MNIFTCLHQSCRMALLLLMLAVMAAPAMAAKSAPMSKSALRDKITTANAKKLHGYIGKAMTRINEADRAEKKDLLVSRLHMCALVNRLLVSGIAKDNHRKKKLLTEYLIFSKLIALMSEGYTKTQTDEFSALARMQIKKELEVADSARLQIVFNSCQDIRSGKITHALSNMNPGKTTNSPSE